MKRWDYADASSSRHGTMKCTVCRNQIEKGRYRYRQKSYKGDWGYVSQHESCTSDDNYWAEWDAAIERSRRKAKELSDACRDFKAKWGVDELDDYIIGEIS